MVPQSVCDVEWKHGQGRRAASDGGDTRISTSCVDYINRDVRLLHGARTRTYAGVLRALQEHAGRHGPQPQPQAKATASQDRSLGHRACGLSQRLNYSVGIGLPQCGAPASVNPASRAWHERAPREWSELQPDIQEWYRERAQQSKVEAAAARAAKRARQQQVLGIVSSEGDGNGGHKLAQQLPENSPGQRAFPHNIVVGVA